MEFVPRDIENEVRAANEIPAETIKRVRRAQYDRTKTMIAVVNAIQISLTYSRIVHSWKATHLFPFREEPPRCKNIDQTFLDQLEEDSVLKTSASKPVWHITGVVTSPEKCELLRKILSGEHPFRPEGTMSSLRLPAPQGTVDVVFDENECNAEVGDYVFQDDDGVFRAVSRTRVIVQDSHNPCPKVF